MIFVKVSSRLPQNVQVFFRSLAHENINGIGKFTVPVLVEFRGHLQNRRPNSENVNIGKCDVYIRIKIFIPNVAAAQDCCLVINGEGFRMHAVIDISCPKDGLDQTIPAPCPWVPKAYLDVGVSVQRNPGFLTLVTVNIVDQHAHPHTAICRPQYLVCQQSAHRILVVHIVLQVDAFIGLPGKQGPGSEGITAMRQ